MCALVRYVRRDIFPKRTSTQRFDEAPKLDGGLGSGTVAVIAIPLAFRRAAACAVEATNGPAVQSLTWTPPSPPLKLRRQKNSLGNPDANVCQ